MGISFSCPGADYDSLNEDVEAVIVKSISFKGDGMKTMLRSVSFKGDDFEPTILKSIGSGKMIIEGSVSFKRKQITPTQLQTVPSITVISSNTKTDDGFNNKDNINTNVAFQGTNSLTETLNLSPSTVPEIPKHKAAVTLQKVYKSFRTRRQLADCAVLVEQKWWKLLDLVELKRTSVSFFDNSKTETAFSRWSRAKAKAAMVGKGLCKDDKAQKLALQHWLEAIDPRHRYGHNLDFYYNKWLQCDSKQPFFYWLDIGEGREINLECCSRVKLQQQCVKYLGPKEREAYEVVLQNGKFFHKCNGKLLDTNKGPKDAKWIFVLSTSRKLYIGEKIKGTFQHSSFLAGGSTSAAGRLVIEDGNLKAVWPHSGHYRPTEENFNEFISFLNENGVDLTNVKENPIDEDEEYRNKTRSSGRRGQSYGIELVKEIGLDYEALNAELEPSSIQANRFKEKEQELIAERRELAQEIGNEGRSELPGIDNGENGYIFHEKNLEQDEEEVPQESIVRRLASRKAMKSYQLGQQLSFKWTTGAGPRIGCVRDYPSELQFRALEQVNLSPRRAGFTIGDYNRSNPMLSDTFIPTYPEAHGLCTNGI